MTHRTMAAAVATAALLTACSSASEKSSGGSPAKEHLTVAWSFAPNGLLAGMTAAMQRGAFSAAGLDVKLVQPSSTSDSVKLLAGHSADLAFNSALDLIIAKAKGVDLISVATKLQDTGNGVLARADSHITTLKQLEGKTVGMSGQIGPRAVFEDILRRNNVDLSKIKFVSVGFNGTQMLATKRIDVLGDAVVYQIPTYNAAAGKPFNDTSGYWFSSYADLGAVRFYGASLGVLRPYLANHKDTIRKFLTVLRQGMQWAIDNPDQAVALEVRMYPQLKQPLTSAQWALASKLVQSDDTRAHGLLWQNPEVFAGMNQFLFQHKISSASIDVGQTMTNDLLAQP